MNLDKLALINKDAELIPLYYYSLKNGKPKNLIWAHHKYLELVFSKSTGDSNKIRYYIDLIIKE
jgi:hypothetical protein